MNNKENPTKAWLMRAWNLRDDIAKLKEQVEVWRELAARTTRSPDDFRTDNGYNTRMADYTIKVADAETKISEMAQRLERIKAEIEAVIAQVPASASRMLLQRRYLMFQDWNMIASKLNYSYIYICGELHREALEEVRRLIKTA